jgi:hypothetical protein
MWYVLAMDHPDTRMLARYALAEITDDVELEALEDHLMECEHCRRRALAVDLIGSSPEEGDVKVLLHIAADGGAEPVPLCGGNSPHLISSALLSGLDATIICSYCLAELQRQRGDSPHLAN